MPINKTLVKLMSAPKISYWFKLLTKFLSLELVLQSLGFAIGILIIRTLSKQEYAYFIIANSMQATINVLCNSGITIGLTSIGGKIWQDKYRFGQIINTSIRLRNYLAIPAATLITPILLWMLISNGSSVIYAVLIILAILVELYFYLYISVFQISLNLQSLFNKVQQHNLIVGFTRLILIGISYTNVLNAAIAVWISTIASGLNYWLLKKSTQKLFDPQAPPNQEYTEELTKIFKYRFPGTLFFAVRGQISVWIITVFGSNENIAEVGALSRLEVLFSVFLSVVQNMIVPSLSRCQSISIFRKRYAILMFVSLSISSILLLLSYLFPEILLWILGKKYSYLVHELFWAILSTIIGITNNVSLSVNSSKGWVKDSWVSIPLTLLTQIVIVLFCNLSTVKGVIIFGIFSQIPSLMVNLYMNYQGLCQKPNYYFDS
jgi:O-antigen/teichoic acid export membrane protein